MRFLFLLIVNIFQIPQVLAQAPAVFEFESEKITIQHRLPSTDNPLMVFKGTITKSEISSKIPIIGKIENHKNQITFYPFVPFNLEQAYTLVYNNEITHFQISIPSDYQRLEVQSIFPSKTILPANILKWYIQFSKPVNSANIYNHFWFIDENGKKIPRAILPLENALLDEAGTLLTVWIEPGRQKRGLGPNEKLGGVFEIGQSYSLVVSKDLRDKNGISISQDKIHQFSVGKPDRISPNFKQWEIKSPPSNSKKTLKIDFKESMDYGSTLKAFRILNSSEEEIMGNWNGSLSESMLSFIPMENWESGSFKIVFPTSIEDLAGNNLNRLFDDAVRPNDEILKSEMVLEFEVF